VICYGYIDAFLYLFPRHFYPTFSDVLFSLLCKAAGGKPVASQRVDSFNSPKVAPPLDSKDISCLPTQKQSPAVGLNARSNEKSLDKSFVVPSIVPRDGTDERNGANSGKESVTFSRTKRGMLLRPAHVRRASYSKIEVERLPEAVESATLSNVTSNLEGAIDSNFQSKHASEDGSRESCEDKHSNIKGVAEKFEKNLSPQSLSNQESCKFLYYSAICLQVKYKYIL
jgi:katanin p80 WD40 repeat-containing subunit B1